MKTISRDINTKHGYTKEIDVLLSHTPDRSSESVVLQGQP
jgi:hypothetical protein